VRKLLLQLDTSPQPSVFDRVVAYDGDADEVMSYGGVTPSTVLELVHGVIFTRGPKELHNSAIFIGGSDMAAGEQLLEAVRKAFWGPMRVSVMLDSNGSNTTAVAAVMKLEQAAGGVQGRRVVVTAGTGPVGLRASGLFARAGADVTLTSRRQPAPAVLDALRERFRGTVRGTPMADALAAHAVLDGVELILNCGPAGTRLVPREAWAGRAGLRAAADLNAVPPLGVEGIEVTDNGVERHGTIVFGALGIGGLKMKIHKACIARLFQQNDLILDVETIAEIAGDVVSRS
jgi:hypothetical protein